MDCHADAVTGMWSVNFKGLDLVIVSTYKKTRVFEVEENQSAKTKQVKFKGVIDSKLALNNMTLDMKIVDGKLI